MDFERPEIGRPTGALDNVESLPPVAIHETDGRACLRRDFDAVVGECRSVSRFDGVGEVGYRHQPVVWRYDILCRLHGETIYRKADRF